jgi:putative membrane protein
MLDFFLALVLGTFFGGFSALIPGLHINLASAIILGLAAQEKAFFAVFLLAFSASYLFSSFIPSIFLGAPDSETALSTLPGHRMLIKGQGYKALQLCLAGALLGFAFGMILLFPSFYLLKLLFQKTQAFTAYFLITAALFIILRQQKKLVALGIFVLSGVFGILVLHNYQFEQPLLPMLSGLFGISTLIVSMNSKNRIKKQKVEKEIKFDKSSILSIFPASLCAFFTALLPALGVGQMAALGKYFFKKMTEESFLFFNAAINSLSFVFSFIALFAISKARNGSFVVMEKLIDVKGKLVVLAVIVFVAACFGFVLSLFIGKIFIKMIQRINYKAISISIILLISSLSFYFDSFSGLIILVTSTSIGLLTLLTKTQRTLNMACLMVPVIVYYL